MEKNNKGTIAKTARTGSAILRPDEAMIKAVYQFNQLRSYSLTAVEIVEWARSIRKLVPNAPADAIEFVIDQMKLELMPYDERLGIQNILRNIKRVYHNGTGWVQIKSAWL